MSRGRNHGRRVAMATAHARAGLLTGLLAGIVLLSGCITTESGHRPESRANVVRWSEFTHDVAFPAGRARLSARARDDLDEFLRQRQIRGADRVLVLSRPILSNAARDRLSLRREVAVRAHLRQRRLAPRFMTGRAIKGRGRNVVTVVVRRPIVVTPHCDFWRSLERGEEITARGSEFGCATTTALGAMVADPNDLLRGRDPGATDGGAIDKAIQRYREGKTKDLKNLDTETGASGGSSGGKS